MWTPLKHKRDAYIKFIELNHRYMVDWRQNGTFAQNDLSVTSFVKRNFPAFDADGIIAKMRSSKKFWAKKKRFRGMSNADIKAVWAASGLEAREAGTKLHKAIEGCYNSCREDSKEDVSDDTAVPQVVPWPLRGTGNPEFDQFLQYAKFMDDRGYIPLRTEWVVYSDEFHSLVGTIDMAYTRRCLRARESVCPTSGGRVLKITLVDWKRIKALKRWANDKGIGLCCDIANANYFHYSMQLNTYKYIIENFYEDIHHDGVDYERIEVEDMWLVVFHNNRKKYMRVKCPNMQPLIRQLFIERRKQLQLLKR